jgi:hypothetical protein
MSIVQFLETLGASPALSTANYVSAIDASGLNEATRDALLRRDAEGINSLIGGRAAMRCFVATPD